MLAKSIDQIEAPDIEELCQRGVYENETIEFKRELPGDGGRIGAWNAGGGISPSARDGLFREIVAFANAQGGTLVLGVAETKDKPARAESITPIARVHELADRLQEAARACIEPPLGSLQVRGIETGSDGEGVVIFRTAGSLTGPHRVTGHGHAFIRRGPSSVQMTMREIQDLTLDLARGAERLEALFALRSASFGQWLQQSPSTDEAAFRITASPLGNFPDVPRISADPRDFPLRVRSRHSVLVDGAPVDCVSPGHFSMRPIVRGVRLYAYDDSARVDVHQTGLIDMWSRHGRTDNGVYFYVGWLIGSYLLVLDALNSMRSIANVPDFEYVIEFALAGHTNTPRFGGGTLPLTTLILGVPNNPGSRWRVDGLPIIFPRITSRGPADRADVLSLAMRDLMDATGEPLPWSTLALPD